MEETRVKRHRLEVPDNFVFPFQQRLDTGDSKDVSPSPVVRGHGIKCYSCGSLFSRDSPHCPQFDATNVTQRDECLPGEVCLLYRWNTGRQRMGSYRECFSSSIILGHPDDPIIPQPDCRLAKTQRDPTSSIQACLCTTDYCNIEDEASDDGSSVGNIQRQSKLSRVISSDSVICPGIVVYNADYADCNGQYELTHYVVLWAVERPVYRHKTKDRFIFWNKGGLGWSIGKKAYLTSGSHWHRSGLDTAEPWQGDWEHGVVVECVTGEQPGQDCVWSGYGQWSECSETCGQGVQVRTRKVLERAHNGGQECQGDSQEFRRCFQEPCLTVPGDNSILCLWSSWSSWSSCSASCGAAGTQQRFRVFLVGQAGREGRSLDEDKCAGGAQENRTCHNEECPAINTAQCCDKLLVTRGPGHEVVVTLSVTLHNNLGVYSNSNNSHYVYHDTKYGWVLGHHLPSINVTIPNQKLLNTTHQCPDGVGVITPLTPDIGDLARVTCHPDTIQQLQYLELNKTNSESESEAEIDSVTVSDISEVPIQLSDVENSNVTRIETKISTDSPIIIEENLSTTTTATSTTSLPKTFSDEPFPSSGVTKSSFEIANSSSGVQCYSCGSLFSSVSSDCDVFDPQDERQQVTCQEGEACLFYAWQVNINKTGRNE